MRSVSAVAFLLFTAIATRGNLASATIPEDGGAIGGDGDAVDKGTDNDPRFNENMSNEDIMRALQEIQSKSPSATSLLPTTSSSPKLPTFAPTTLLSPSPNPSTLPTIEITSVSASPIFVSNSCEDSFPVPIRVDIVFDEFPTETRWELINAFTNEIIIEDGAYTSEETLISKSHMVCPSECLKFVIHDTYGDGLTNTGSYGIFYGNEVIREGGGDFGTEESTIFGAGCATLPSSEPSVSSEPSASSKPSAEPSARNCDPFQQFNDPEFEDNSSVENRCAWSISPSFGSELGGTVVRIETEDPEPELCNWSVRFDVDHILCRFENDSFSQLVPGIVVGFDRNIIECLSPFGGQAMNVKVSFAAIPRGCDDESIFFEVNEKFQYIGDRGSVVPGDFPLSSTQTPSIFRSFDSFSFGSVDSVSVSIDTPYYNSRNLDEDREDVESGDGSNNSSNTNSSITNNITNNTITNNTNDAINTNNTEKITNTTQSTGPSGPSIDNFFFFVNDTIQINWSPAAIFTEGLGKYNNFDRSPQDLRVTLEVLVYNATADTEESDRSPFVTFSIMNLNATSNITQVFVQPDIEPFMFDWGSKGDMVALGLIRVVLSSRQFWNEDQEDQGARWVLATRTSRLLGVLSKKEEGNVGECPILYSDDCKGNDPDPCPPSHDVALEDIRFLPDKTCPWPSGNNSCSINFDLEADELLTCFNAGPEFPCSLNKNRTNENEINENEINENEINEFIETNGCLCQNFHPGAAGCVTDGFNQCCYTDMGALITEYNDGAGRPKCVKSEDTSFPLLNTFLFDTLPYVFCCGMNELEDSCESYYNALPNNILDDGYDTPNTAAVTFGDPHLVTFDRVSYNFNGYGEYVALCGGPQDFGENEIRNLCITSRRRLTDDNKRTAVHYRFRPFTVGGVVQRGTSTVGVAIQDPSFYNGTKRLTIILSKIDRLHVYEDSVLIHFGRIIGQGRMEQLRSDAKISIPKETDRTKQKVFVMNISFKSGLRVKISEAEGVMNPTITRPNGSNNFIGLLGQGDGNQTNEFITPDGTLVPIIIKPNIDDNSFLALNDKQIFESFGTEWEIKSEQRENSLFGAIEGVIGQDFNSFFVSNFTPDFDSSFDPNNSSTVENPRARKICAEYEDFFIRQACIYDFGITENEALVRSSSDFAVEEKVIQEMLVNTPPGVRNGGRTQNRNVGVSEGFLFNIESFDTDGDTITASMTRNDDNLFELSGKGSAPGMFEVRFLGIDTVGSYRAHITLTDDMIPVLVTTTAEVTLAEPPTAHPNISPTISPSSMISVSPIFSSTDNVKSNSNIGVIIGGGTGGLVILIIMGFGLTIMLKRKHRRLTGKSASRARASKTQTEAKTNSAI